MTALKLRKIGNSVGVVLPADVLGRLHLAAGDMVHLTDAPDGLHLSPYDPNFEEQMNVARKIMKKSRNVLRELAK